MIWSTIEKRGTRGKKEENKNLYNNIKCNKNDADDDDDNNDDLI